MSEADEWKKLYYELKSVALGLEQQRDSLRSENERLRKDAERYRKIRKYYWLDLLTDFFDVDADNAAQLDEFTDGLGENLNSDAAIDAAKEAE